MKPEELLKELHGRGRRLARRIHEHLEREDPTILPGVAEELLAVVRLMDAVSRECRYDEADQ